MPSDVLYHLALSTDTHDLESMFGDVKFVCVGGTLKRMQSFAQYIGKELGVETPLEDITRASHRYSMFKIGPVLSVTVNNFLFYQLINTL
jgi:uridine phosphorylase